VLGFPGAGALFVDGARRDLFGQILRIASIEEPLFDVLVLTLALGTP
jgi:hypothetical protein